MHSDQKNGDNGSSRPGIIARDRKPVKSQEY